MPVPIGSVEALATTVNHFYPDLKSEFVTTFDNRETEPEWIRKLFRGAEVTGAYESFHAWGSSPLPLPLERGQYLHDSGFEEYILTLYVHDYATPRLTWHINDVQDSRAPKSLKDRAQDSSKKLGDLKKFTIPELLAGSASTFLHPEVSFTNIFGGTGLFSSSHSYNGQTLDNSIAGDGTAAGNIIDDIWEVRQTFRQMVDTLGRTYWDQEAEGNTSWCIIIPEQLEQVFSQVLKSELLVPAGATAPASNYTRDVFGDKVQVKILETLTDTDNWFVVRQPADAEGMTPFIWGERKGLEVKTWLMGNSDWSKETHQEGLQWWRRDLIGVHIPQTAVVVTN